MTLNIFLDFKFIVTNVMALTPLVDVIKDD